jgi:hypothetical protein
MILHEASKLKCISLPTRVKSRAKRVSDRVQGRDTSQRPKSDKPYRREGEEEIPRNCFLTASNYIVPVKWIDEVFRSNFKGPREGNFLLQRLWSMTFGRRESFGGMNRTAGSDRNGKGRIYWLMRG